MLFILFNISLTFSLFNLIATHRYDVSWSPCLPAVISTCSFDRSVQFYSLSGAKSSLGRAPKWLRKPVGATFGFGGKLATFDNNPTGGSAAAAGQKKSAASGSVDVKISQIVENEELVKACQYFQNAVVTDDFKNFCHLKSEDGALSEHDRSVWMLMRVICFEDKAREELLNYLGFDTNNIVDMASQYAQSLASKNPPAPEAANSSDWASGITTAIGHLSLGDDEKSDIAATTSDMVSSAVKGEEAEHMIRKALVVGNFAAAVDVCLEAGLMTEALLLAQCGDPELWARTQHEFFVRQRKRKPFLNILQSVIKNELMGYVLQSDLSKWRETLALLSTYGKSEEFNGMCEALANRLETEMKDIPSATLCYMCATNVERTIEFWAAELKSRNDVKGSTDTVALQQFVEKVVVYTSAHKVEDLGAACSQYFAEYAGLLASQGILDVAPQYLKGDSAAECVLRDRLFHAGPKQVVGARPPTFPFEKVNVVAVNPATVAASMAMPSGTASAASTFANPSASASQDMMSPQRVGHQPQQQQQQTQQQVNTPVQQQTQQTQQPQAEAQGGGLPAGWIQLQDPASSRPYYVDQSTGQSQWEPPAPVAQAVQPAVPQAVQQQQPMQQQQQPVQQPVQQQQQKLAPTPTPTQPVAEPQTVAPQAEPAVAAASVAASVSVGGGAGAELQAMLDAVTGKVTGGDKRQTAMIKTALAALHKQIAGGVVSPETMGKLDQLVTALLAKNSAAANVINTDLTNSVWALHKDWIKGLKYLIQLHCKY
jgi:protein transport protein SEC31